MCSYLSLNANNIRGKYCFMSSYYFTWITLRINYFLINPASLHYSPALEYITYRRKASTIHFCILISSIWTAFIIHTFTYYSHPLSIFGSPWTSLSILVLCLPTHIPLLLRRIYSSSAPPLFSLLCHAILIPTYASAPLNFPSSASQSYPSYASQPLSLCASTPFSLPSITVLILHYPPQSSSPSFSRHYSPLASPITAEGVRRWALCFFSIPSLVHYTRKECKWERNLFDKNGNE